MPNKGWVKGKKGDAQAMLKQTKKLLKGKCYRMWVQDDPEGEIVKFRLFSSDELENEKGILIALDKDQAQFLLKIEDAFVIGQTMEDGTTTEQFFEVLKQHGYPKL